MRMPDGMNCDNADDGLCSTACELRAARDSIDVKDLRIKELEGKISAIVGWLESNQPDVWRRGLWDALHKTSDGR